MIDWDEAAEHYCRLIAGRQTSEVHNEIRTLVGQAASQLPRDNPAALDWFVRALQHPQKKWFVARVVAQVSPVPSALLDPLLLCALREPNPSSNNEFIRPCLKTFGASKVKERVSALAAEPGVSENNGLYKVTYWVEPRA